MQSPSVSVQQNEGMSVARASAARWIMRAHIIVKTENFGECYQLLHVQRDMLD